MSFRDREQLAQKQKEEAKRFLQTNHCGPRDPTKPNANNSFSKDSRDNTFEILRTTTTQPKLFKPTSAAASTNFLDIPGPTIQGWVLDELQFIRHETTGCAVRTQAPNIVGEGIHYWKPIPTGWKLIKLDSPEITAPRYYFWNPYINESTFTFPMESAIPIRNIEEDKIVFLDNTKEEDYKIEEEEEEEEVATSTMTFEFKPIEPAVKKRTKLDLFD